MLSVALLIRFNRLHTTQQAQRYYGAQLVESTTCPHCGEGTDDADHALNTCNLAEIIHLIKLRHDHAVHLILAAIKTYLHGALYVHSDARNTNRHTNTTAPLPDAGTQRMLPAAVLPLHLQSSFPDILLIDIPHAEITAFQQARRPVPMLKRTGSTIHIIEVKYAFDLIIHDRTHQAIDQHTQLQENLIAAGWGTVLIHPFIIGSAGTIRQHSHTILEICGVTDQHARDLLLRRISISSVRRTAEIVQARLKHKSPLDTATPTNRNSSSPEPGNPPVAQHDESLNQTPPQSPERNSPPDTSPHIPRTADAHHDAPRRSSRKRRPSEFVLRMDTATRRCLFPHSIAAVGTTLTTSCGPNHTSPPNVSHDDSTYHNPSPTHTQLPNTINNEHLNGTDTMITHSLMHAQESNSATGTRHPNHEDGRHRRHSAPRSHNAGRKRSASAALTPLKHSKTKQTKLSSPPRDLLPDNFVAPTLSPTEQSGLPFDRG